MATIAISTEIDIIEKYEELVKSSLGSESIYIRAKETISELLVKGGLTGPEKSKLIGETIAGLSSGLASACMSTALQWEAKEKDLALQKLELEQQLDILKHQVTKAENEAVQVANADLIAQANSLRNNGAMTVLDGKVVSLNDSGVAYETILLTREKVTTEGKAQALSDAKLNETNAGVHKIIADTYVNYGMYSGYAITGTGVTGITNNTPTGLTTLSNAQLEIAKEQAKGYVYNAWSNVASGLGSTIGVALTSETDIFSGDNAGILATWKTVIEKLNATTPASF